VKHIVSTCREESVTKLPMYAIQAKHINSLALEFAPRFPVFLHGREAKTLPTILGTMVVTKSCVSSGGGCVVVGLKASQGKVAIRALITQPRWAQRAFRFYSDDSAIIRPAKKTPIKRPWEPLETGAQGEGNTPTVTHNFDGGRSADVGEHGTQ